MGDRHGQRSLQARGGLSQLSLSLVPMSWVRVSPSRERQREGTNGQVPSYQALCSEIICFYNWRKQNEVQRLETREPTGPAFVFFSDTSSCCHLFCPPTPHIFPSVSN